MFCHHWIIHLIVFGPALVIQIHDPCILVAYSPVNVWMEHFFVFISRSNVLESSFGVFIDGRMKKPRFRPLNANWPICRWRKVVTGYKEKACEYVMKFMTHAVYYVSIFRSIPLAHLTGVKLQDTVHRCPPCQNDLDLLLHSSLREVQKPQRSSALRNHLPS